MILYQDKSRLFNELRGFGASGAWWAQCVGGWTATDAESGIPVRDRISQLLFSKEKGIGLSVYRYNLGGGSAESGKGFYFDELRRAESFGRDGKYDFGKDANAVFMMKQAVRDGADTVIMFVNSPPEYLTKNGRAQLGKRQIFRTNLAKKNYSAFADYCLDAAEHFIKEGIPVRYISPVNEPLWIWNGGQEGCHYSPRQAGAVMKCFARKMISRPALKNVRLSGVENGDIRWFNKCYTAAMLNYPEVRKLVDSVDVHSYFTHIPVLPFINDRPAFLKRFDKWMKKAYPGVPTAVSEWCHMKGGRDCGMESALETAQTICEDITLLNAVSWQHWIACSPYDYCDGLIYLDTDNQRFTLTKRYFVTGNFSKYIKPGMRRFYVKSDNKDILSAGFTDGNETVTILVNLSEKYDNFISGHDGLAYLTDDSHDLAEIPFGSGENVMIPPKSVITLVC